MVNYTPNLNLAKPTLSDVADITVISANFDILDSALAKMVTTDSPQAISGRKTFDMPPIIRNNNDQTTTVPATQIQTQPYQLVGRDNRQIFFEQVITDTNGNRWHSHNMYGTDGTRHQLQMHTYTDGTAQVRIPNVPSNAFSNAAVTKGYVEATDRVTNNLVHRSADETIDGIKTHLKQIIRRTPFDNILNYSSSGNTYSSIAYIMDNQSHTLAWLEHRFSNASQSTHIGLRKFSTDGSYVSKNIGVQYESAKNIYYGMCPPTPADAPTDAIVTKSYVDTTDSATRLNNLVHTIGDEHITGTKFFEGLTIANSIVQGHHNLVRVDGTGWRKIYTGTLEFNHHNIVLMVMPRRIGFGMGILSMGGHNGTMPVVNWMCGNIPTARRSDFVITYEESTQIATIWQQGTGATDGYCTCILAHSWNGNCYNNPWKSSTDNTLYNITESGYDEVVDGQTIHHTFKYYVRSE